jgi:TonB family protein
MKSSNAPSFGDRTWRSNRGSALGWGLLAAAALIFVAAVMIYKYHQDMLRYQRGPKSVPWARFGQRRAPKGLWHHVRQLAPPEQERHYRTPLPSFNILGPLKDRPIIEKVLPSYPLWAEEQGVSGKIQLHFRVTSNGDVAPNIFVVQTIGYPDFDSVAVDALKKWKFQPLKYPEIGPEQAGIINFNFMLSNQMAPL